MTAPDAPLVLKFGGTSMGTLERVRASAAHVARERAAGRDVAVVVSAMAGETNRLVALAREADPAFDASPQGFAEYDAVVASGEQVAAGLMALVLRAMGLPARSWQGWQLPVSASAAFGSARIEGVGAEGVRAGFAAGEVAVVTGFQGVHAATGRVATLGRGGSDTSAVALAAALGAERCDIYTDVDGVYTTDPRVVPRARRLERVAFEEMLEMASMGAKVLQVRSVELALLRRVRTVVRSSFDDPARPGPGTLICDEEEIVEQPVVTGIAFARDEAQITLRRVPDRPGVAAGIFGPLADAGVNVDMIIQVVSDDAKATDITFTVPASDLPRSRAILEAERPSLGYAALEGASDVVKVSAIGVGMRSHAGVAAKAFRALAEKGINIRAITTSEIKFSVLIDAAYTELAVRTLHSLYGLDKEG